VLRDPLAAVEWTRNAELVLGPCFAFLWAFDLQQSHPQWLGCSYPASV